ncbi:MAG: aldehyde dehydrogenase family protein [Bacteroidia bacterium]|nr:MAG: aldehyde dehydrogenase family protein [Bacteroidia bacterium]
MKELIESQRNYFLAGHTRSVSERKKNLRKLHNLILENEQVLAEAIYKDFKKSFQATLENELSLPYGEINVAIRKLNRWSRPRTHLTNLSNFPARTRSFPVPFGVTLVIGPWNYPYMLSLIPLVSSLAAGNTVVLKPSELTFYSSAALAKLINTNFPKELVYVQEGGVEETTELLKQKFDKIFFTGSTQVGKIVMKAAAEQLTPVTLELGGKNPVIVMPDCHLKRSAQRIAWGKLHNNGNACVSPDHLYVHEDIKDEFVQEVKRYMTRITGPDPRQSPILPRMVNEKHFDRVVSMIDPEKVVHGGTFDRDDLYIEPTIMDGVKAGDKVMQEEVFGPLLPVLTYNNLDELLKLLKSQPAPLSLYIFTRNISLAKKIMREVPSGGGMINEVVMYFINMNAPFGGLGDSGMGHYHGKPGFDAFSHHKTVMIKPTWFELFLKHPPHRKIYYRIFRSVLGRSFRNFWK